MGFSADAERLSAFYPNAVVDFYGAPSCALCVYKSGDPWPVHTGPQAQRIIREARPVYDHPIKDTWRDVGERVCTLLDDKKVLWISIDPVAFAEAGEKTFSPLLLWIGVEPASLVYEDANIAAEAITFFLAKAGFEDIEVGFRESIVTRFVSGPKMLSFDPLLDPIPELRKPFTPTLGLSIATLNTPHFEGIGGLYFRESKESDRVLLLTCAHVARPLPAHPNTGLSRKFDWATSKGNKVYVGGNISLSDYGDIMLPKPEDLADYEYPRDGILQASGVIKVDEIHNPKHFDANGEKCLLVVKNGLATGTTFGRVMGMESFTRVHNDYGIKETSIEVAVLPCGNKNGPFSAAGESGSIILTRDGSILGVLTGGAGTDGRTHVSYLTPYWYIEEKIKVFPGCYLYGVV